MPHRIDGRGYYFRTCGPNHSAEGVHVRKLTFHNVRSPSESCYNLDRGVTYVQNANLSEKQDI